MLSTAKTIQAASASKRLNFYTCIAGGLVGLAWLYLCFASQAYGEATLTQLLGSCLFIGILCAGLWWSAVRNQQALNLHLVLAFALLFRVIGFFTYPILEDDFYRFLWDGYKTASSGTPYGIAPAAFFDNNIDELFEPILDGINYPHVATIYGPTTQWTFYLAHQIAPAEIWPLKLILLFADILILLLLAYRIPNNVLMLYAWSPLIIKEFVISVHPDLLGVMFVVLALNAYLTKRDLLMGITLALAAGVKPFALVIVPFLLLWRWCAWVGFIITALFIALPFGLRQAWLPEGLTAMSDGWLFNAPLYELLLPVFNYEQIRLGLLLTFLLAGGFYGLAWAWQAFKNKATDPRPIPRGDCLFTLLFLCLPAFNPWYAIWLMPFAVYYPRLWVWVGSYSLLLSYASGINLDGHWAGELQAYQHPSWVLITEFVLIAAAWIGALVWTQVNKPETD